jgi:RNA polymerase sigma-70 factor (ECF subfamily)
MSPAAEGPDDLERFRAYLLLLARMQLQGRPEARLGASDLVQQTLLEAWQQADKFRGATDREGAAWLRQALAHNLADGVRAQHRHRRDVGRERPLEQSSQRGDWPAAEQSSPSQRAAHHEEDERLAEALAGLPEAQREALVLQHWHGLMLAEIGERLGRTPVAVAGLLKRGLKALRARLDGPG